MRVAVEEDGRRRNDMAEIGRPGRNPRQGITAKALKIRNGAPAARPRPGRRTVPAKARPKS